MVTIGKVTMTSIEVTFYNEWYELYYEELMSEGMDSSEAHLVAKALAETQVYNLTKLKERLL